MWKGLTPKGLRLDWSAYTKAVVKKGVLRKNTLEGKLLLAFYCSTIENILAHCISGWYTGCSAADRRAL